MNHILRERIFIHFLSRAEDILSSFAYLYFIYFSRHNKKLLNHGHKYMGAGAWSAKSNSATITFHITQHGRKDINGS